MFRNGSSALAPLTKYSSTKSTTWSDRVPSVGNELRAKNKDRGVGLGLEKAKEQLDALQGTCERFQTAQENKANQLIAAANSSVDATGTPLSLAETERTIAEQRAVRDKMNKCLTELLAVFNKPTPSETNAATVEADLKAPTHRYTPRLGAC